MALAAAIGAGYIFQSGYWKPLTSFAFWCIFVAHYLVQRALPILNGLHRRVILALSTYVLNLTWFLIGVRLTGGQIFYVFLWLWITGLIFKIVRSMVHRSPSKLIVDLAWEIWLVPLLALLVLFGYSIYGKVKTSWGGGLPIPVYVHFLRSTPFSDSTNAAAYLIEETDRGYYLAHTQDGERASFIPREAVGSVDFSKQP